MRSKMFITPVYGIELTKSVNNEFRIIRTLLVAKEKLWRNRKKYGIPKQISKLPKFDRENFFEISDTFAIIQFSNNRNDSIVYNESLKIIQKELSILSISLLQYKRRGEIFTPSIMYPSIIPADRYAITNINLGKLAGTLSIGGLLGQFQPLRLDDNWKSYHKKNFFFDLLKLAKNKNKKIRFDKGWLEVIMRACILIGESQQSNNLKHAFLWNMIALEILLTKDDNKFRDILPKRIEAFFGWLNDWKTEKFAEKIQTVYGKRNRFVHQANEEEITVEDLLFTDLLLFNLVLNITSLPKLFSTKDQLINFSEKMEAQKTLGIKRKPIGLKFIKTTRNNDDIKKFFGQKTSPLI